MFSSKIRGSIICRKHEGPFLNKRWRQMLLKNFIWLYICVIPCSHGISWIFTCDSPVCRPIRLFDFEASVKKCSVSYHYIFFSKHRGSILRKKTEAGLLSKGLSHVIQEHYIRRYMCDLLYTTSILWLSIYGSLNCTTELFYNCITSVEKFSVSYESIFSSKNEGCILCRRNEGILYCKLLQRLLGIFGGDCWP